MNRPDWLLLTFGMPLSLMAGALAAALFRNQHLPWPERLRVKQGPLLVQAGVSLFLGVIGLLMYTVSAVSRGP
jgi:hypothetical protein